MKYFGGVEGGSTSSTLIVIDADGKEVATIKGLSTNPLLDGELESFNRLADMIERAKSILEISRQDSLESLGLCLSGCTDLNECDRLSSLFLSIHPESAKYCVIRNDTVGSVYSSGTDSGIVIISGTGSNSILFDSRGIIATCGGWGHFFSDEGSAYWIAARAYKTLLDDNDNYRKCPHDTSRLREVICKHFGIANERLIEAFYIKPDKKNFASLCKELYASTKAKSDPAIDDIFAQAGHALAMKVVALLPKADQAVKESGLDIILVGSVFNGWDLLEPGFVKLLSEHLRKFKVYKLESSSAIGAAKFGAMQCGIDITVHPTKTMVLDYNADKI